MAWNRWAHLSHGDPRSASFQKGDHLLVVRITAIDVNEMLGEQVVTLLHQLEEHVHEVQPGEDHGLIVREILQVLTEIDRMLRPVHRGVDVVADVVPIVPATVVEGHVGCR